MSKVLLSEEEKEIIVASVLDKFRQDKLAQSNIEDAKDIEKRIMPLVEEYKNQKSNTEEIGKLIGLLSNQYTFENSPKEKLRGILFTFRDNGFFESSVTQQQWHDLAEVWKVTKYFPHLINKTKLTSF